MKTCYSEKLRCIVCGSESHFEFNDDKSCIKCTQCNREYLGGYDELLELNQEIIVKVKQQIAKEAKGEILDQLKREFVKHTNLKIY